MWPGTGSRRFADVADGTSNTLLVVEVRNCGVHWAEPRDLHVDQMAPVINPRAGEGISSAHPDGANVLFTDGSVRFLASDLPAKTLRGLLTIAGGEDARPEEF
jgi:prepilin-type processing-associated H-X9-DG protein